MVREGESYLPGSKVSYRSRFSDARGGTSLNGCRLTRDRSTETGTGTAHVTLSGGLARF